MRGGLERFALVTSIFTDSVFQGCYRGRSHRYARSIRLVLTRSSLASIDRLSLGTRKTNSIHSYLLNGRSSMSLALDTYLLASLALSRHLAPADNLAGT